MQVIDHQKPKSLTKKMHKKQKSASHRPKISTCLPNKANLPQKKNRKATILPDLNRKLLVAHLNKAISLVAYISATK